MTTDLAVVDHGDRPPAPVTLFRTEQPNEVVARATETANALAKVVRDQKLTVRIGQGEHCRVEAWTLLGTMLGVYPICVWTRKLEDGWEARVEARTIAGALVGAAEAQCLRSERTWSSRDDYALRSMAQTRATSKALRQPLGFVMTLAGFSATPAEEMPQEADFSPVEESPFTAPPAAQSKTISGAQVKKLWATWRDHAAGRSDDILKAKVMAAANVDSTKAIPKDKFQAVLDSIMASDDEIPFA